MTCLVAWTELGKSERAWFDGNKASFASEVKRFPVSNRETGKINFNIFLWEKSEIFPLN
jgi:hypothetical protein